MQAGGRGLEVNPIGEVDEQGKLSSGHPATALPNLEGRIVKDGVWGARLGKKQLTAEPRPFTATEALPPDPLPC